MAKRVAMVLVLCCVFSIAVQTIQAQYMLFEYGQCYKDCQNNCQSQGTTASLCKMRCDNQCMMKKTMDRVGQANQGSFSSSTSTGNAQNANSHVNASPSQKSFSYSWSSSNGQPAQVTTQEGNN
ncbi:hypothetical protein SAY86_011064 [Trapa natans]|uniref:Uncharacterized protein n=1 Tax=Trapa natans TaxID=22666 RepID=A0AAN7R4T8_TRANT|nr:hypothetical protein SAY86_011064 [Trapa natans]